MSIERVQQGAQRRELKRRVLGRTGSLRRWLLGSVIWLSLCGVAFLLLRNPLIPFVAVIADALAFVARSLPVGDEDELNPALTRSVLRAVRSGVEPLEEVVRADPADWFSSRPNTFIDVPPPPVAEEEGSGERDRSGSS